jgi:glycosyltransferase involved in cell wall biosynthesis
MDKTMRITLIVPCYNEEANFQKGVLDKIGNYTRDNEQYCEVLIVDDGSTDLSRDVVKRDYLPKYPKFRLVECEHRGKAMTVISGIHAACAEYVIFTDADLATPIEEAQKLVDRAIKTKAPIVIGSRGATRPDAPLARKIMALGMIVIRTVFFGLGGIKDTQCGFKLFHKAKAEKVISKLQVFNRKKAGKHASVSAIFDLEFLFVARKMRLKISEVPVSWRHVETKRVSFFKDIFESLADMVRLKWYEIQGRYHV